MDFRTADRDPPTYLMQLHHGVNNASAVPRGCSITVNRHQPQVSTGPKSRKTKTSNRWRNL